MFEQPREPHLLPLHLCCQRDRKRRRGGEGREDPGKGINDYYFHSEPRFNFSYPLSLTLRISVRC